jgi:hypothetical protein
MTLPVFRSRRLLATCASAVCAASFLLAGEASAGTWQAMGVGDCAGYDVAATRGSAPEPARCDASAAGQTAICWPTGCTYKSIPTPSCVGGASPGQMFTCVTQAPKPVNVSWQPAGIGDCSGRDVAGTAGPFPDPTRCNASFAGQTAVCWASGCTYKSVTTATCAGGPNPGQLYTCAGEAPAAAPTQPVPQPASPSRPMAPPMPPAPPTAALPSLASPPAPAVQPPVAAAPAAPAPRAAKVSGKHYYVINYAGEKEDPHEFVVNWTGCKVLELSEAGMEGKLDISVLHCKPGKRLVVKTTQLPAKTAWTLYDWVVLDNGATLAGSYHEPTMAGPSVGRRAR